MGDLQVKETRQYDQFKLFNANRDVGKGHVNTLKKAFEERGNLTRVQPILVNDSFEIVDGQHRFVAAQALGEPIYYIMYPGLTVGDARSMNIMHKSWTTDDYAKSYSDAGDASYTRYLRLKEETGATHSTILAFSLEADITGTYMAFRNGEFTMTPEDYERVKSNLDKLAEAQELVPNVRNQKEFALAYLRCMQAPEFDQERMIKKLKQVGSVIPSYSSIADYQRAFEDAYNRGMPDTSRVRLF